VKPTAMREDALLDLTDRIDIVIHPFLGSGSSLIAAERAAEFVGGSSLIGSMLTSSFLIMKPPRACRRSSPRRTRPSHRLRPAERQVRSHQSKIASTRA
jgi:hypothetical protein